MPYNPWMQARGQSMGALGGQMQPYEMKNFMQQGSQSSNPFQLQGGNTNSGQFSSAFDRENVQASQGAGAAPGADWTARLGQQVGQDMGQMQRQQQLAQAAYMRNTPTPGGMQAWGAQQQQGGGDAQRWGQMMQGLQGMRQGGQGQGGMMGGMRQGNRF